MNNKRRRESQEKIQKTFIELLQTREIKEISVSALIKTAGLNRSTFYANYIDIFDLADKTREKLESDFSNLFADYDYYNERSGALKMFRHIKENQIFYNTYFKLCYDDSHLVSKYDTERAQKEHMDSNLKYHIEFFRNDLDNTIRVQCAAEGEIFRFTALSSLKYSGISAFIRAFGISAFLRIIRGKFCYCGEKRPRSRDHNIIIICPGIPSIYISQILYPKGRKVICRENRQDHISRDIIK